MAVSTVSTALFGAPGVSDPYAFEPGLVGIKRRVNFNVANSTANGVYALIPVPKGMTITAIRVEEVASGGKCTASTAVSLLIADGTADDVALGSAVSVGGDTLAYSVQNLATPVVCSANQMVCVKTTGANTAGGVIATVIGYLADGESIEAIEMSLPKWRAGQTNDQFVANVSGGDPYNANRAGLPIYPVYSDQ